MNPLHFPRLWRAPTALEIASRELEQAKRDLLAHSAQREYYSAVEGMLELRIARLEQAVRELASPPHQESSK